MWPWKRKPNREGFPKGFKVQRIGIAEAKAISGTPAPDIANYFRAHPEAAKALLYESYDKRFTPSTFIEENDGEFRVGWFTRDRKYECLKSFSSLADAAKDYLLFSLGKDRWTPPTS